MPCSEALWPVGMEGSEPAAISFQTVITNRSDHAGVGSHVYLVAAASEPRSLVLKIPLSHLQPRSETEQPEHLQGDSRKTVYAVI